MYNNLSNKIYELREVFPWPAECSIDNCHVPDYMPGYQLAEIVHSAEYCTDAMIRCAKYIELKQKAFEHALNQLEAKYPRIADDFNSDRLGFIQNNVKSTM